MLPTVPQVQREIRVTREQPAQQALPVQQAQQELQALKVWQGF
jgi:hypothetical protein